MRFGGLVGMATVCAWLVPATAAPAETLHATYSIELIGLPIGIADVSAQIANSRYSVEARAHLSGVASWIKNARGASTGSGELYQGKVSPATFATSATNDTMTRTIRMSLSGNTVVGVDISPPFEERPDRVPLTEKDTRNVLDPVGAFVLPAPVGASPTSPAACARTLPIFDGYTRFDVSLSYVGERKVKTKGYAGPVAICAVRYIPVAGHRRDRPATKFMAENRDMETWLAPVGNSGALMPYRVSIRTMIGTLTVEATEFRVDGK